MPIHVPTAGAIRGLLATLPAPDPAWFLRPGGEDGSGGLHGIGHTLRVMAHAVEIGRALDVSPWELESVTLAALWHDIGRTHDGRDPYHGAKSAGKLVGLGLHRCVEPIVLETALHAVTHHSLPDAEGERGAQRLKEPASALRVFRLLKDADGLDRVRLGDLDARQLRFEISRTRIDRALDFLAATG